MSRTGRLVVIGGGVIGTAAAYYAARRGWQVTVIERSKIGGGCSHGNCGYVSPSHVLPLAGPGVLWPTLKTMFYRNSPFKLRFRLDPALFSWLLNFAGRCNEQDQLQSAQAIHTMLQAARKLYDDLILDEQLQCEWETRGILFVNRSAQGLRHADHVAHLLKDEFGVNASRYEGEAVQQLEPALLPGNAGAWLYECDAHLRPDRLMSQWQTAIVRQGVRIEEQTNFLGFKEYKQKINGVQTDRGDYPADAIVIATGAWTPQLQSLLGCRVPIQPGKGYSITMNRPQNCPVLPMIFEDHRVAITPFQSGYRIGSTMEFAGYDETLNPERLELLRDGAKLYLHDPLGAELQEEWWGWRPMTYDSVPIIGPVPDRKNVFLASGHSMLGVSLATSSGKLISELISDEVPHIDPEPYAVTRF